MAEGTEWMPRSSRGMTTMQSERAARPVGSSRSVERTPRRIGSMVVRFVLDPANPPRLTPERQARLEAMTDEELTQNALDDPDNPPLLTRNWSAAFWAAGCGWRGRRPG